MPMKTLKLWRTFKEGAQNFRRNGWLTFATVSVLTLSLFIVSLSFLRVAVTHVELKNLRDKVSINVSFNPDVPESRILEIRDELAKYKKEISSVDYISRNEALDDFLAESGNDPTIVQAIEEIGENPLLASLNIKAVRPEDYPLIVEQIEKSTFQEDISRINYERNKRVFERLETRNREMKREALVQGTLLILIAMLITFNTVRITIYSRRQEFEIMRLVGASNLYVKMPSIFEGIFYGLTAALVTIFLLLANIYFNTPFVDSDASFLDRGFLGLYLNFFWLILAVLLFLGIALGVISSALAIRRYLKV